jgi:hypothetical protein
MAGRPRDRVRFTTGKPLLSSTSSVALNSPVNMTVFYAEDEGAKRAANFVARNPGHMRLDDLLQSTPEGRRLWKSLTVSGRPWSDLEEVWWELSWRLARSAKGIVNIFGPQRLVKDRPLSEFRHKYATGGYANSVLEKVELPELEANPRVLPLPLSFVTCA